jgi:UDP-N-acetylglucosamine:LPS N-acetylglucosamine transferase
LEIRLQKILAIASGGGHWEQMMIIKEGFKHANVVYANTFDGLAEKSGVGSAHIVRDCNRSSIVASMRCMRDVWRVIRLERPQVIISTGAAPGLIAIAMGRVLGAKTIWIDSVANSERLSMSGRFAGWFADLWLTQWEHLNKPDGPHYWGSVL